MYFDWVYRLAIDAMAQAKSCWMGEVQPNVWCCGKDVLGHTKWSNDSTTRKPNTKTQACARFQACVMRIKSRVRNDDGKWIFMQTFKNVFLKMIKSSFWKIVWKEGFKHVLLKEKGYALASSVFGMEANLNCKNIDLAKVWRYWLGPPSPNSPSIPLEWWFQWRWNLYSLYRWG